MSLAPMIRYDAVLACRYRDAEAWCRHVTTGFDNPTCGRLIRLIDEALEQQGGQRHRPDSPVWRRVFTTIKDRCARNGQDPAEFLLAQVENKTTGAGWLISKGKPVTQTLFTSQQAQERYHERVRSGIRHAKSHPAGKCLNACVCFAEIYLSGGLQLSMSEADKQVREDYPAWDRTIFKEYPMLRWMAHRNGVNCLFSVSQHPKAASLRCPADDWTWADERDDLLRIAENLRSQEAQDRARSGKPKENVDFESWDEKKLGIFL